MTWRKRILATVKGEPSDRLPFVPRLDLWYKANRANGTLPDRYREAALEEIVDGLDAGYHAVIPDFRDFDDERENAGYSLGVFNCRSLPFRTLFDRLDVRQRRDGDVVTTEFATPHGPITTRLLYDESMRKAGVTLAHTAERAIKSPADYAAVGYIFENLAVEPAYDAYLAHREKVGERGVAVGFSLIAASPVHLLLKELMDLDFFVYQLYDNEAGLESLTEKMAVYYDRVLEVVAASPAELVLLGANYDSGVTSPPIFRKYITPWLKKYSLRLHGRGQYLVTHTDGENRGLIDEYLASGMDVADSICPSPMTKLTLKEVRSAFGRRITIWGGLPSICLLRESMRDRDFESYVNAFFEDIGSGDHLIISFADTTPPGARFDRIEKVSALARQFGPVRP